MLAHKYFFPSTSFEQVTEQSAKHLCLKRKDKVFYTEVTHKKGRSYYGLILHFLTSMGFLPWSSMGKKRAIKI